MCDFYFAVVANPKTYIYIYILNKFNFYCLKFYLVYVVCIKSKNVCSQLVANYKIKNNEKYGILFIYGPKNKK